MGLDRGGEKSIRREQKEIILPEGETGRKGWAWKAEIGEPGDIDAKRGSFCAVP